MQISCQLLRKNWRDRACFICYHIREAEMYFVTHVSFLQHSEPKGIPFGVVYCKDDKAQRYGDVRQQAEFGAAPEGRCEDLGQRASGFCCVWRRDFCGILRKTFFAMVCMRTGKGAF